MKCYKFLTKISLIILLLAGETLASSPLVQDIIITDVTSVSFSVIWTSDQPSNCDIAVFTNENGTEDISATLMITPHPTRSNNPTIVTAAQNRGVMKVRVSSLTPSSIYYFRLRTTSTSTGEETLTPLNSPYPPVTTATAVAKTTGEGLDETPFTNDLIYQDVFEADGTSPANGAMLLASIEGGSYPLSSFVGDGLTSPKAVIDLNNLYSNLSRETFALQGGQKIILTAFYGNDAPAESALVVPRNQNLLSARSPIGLAEAILILQAMTEPAGGPDLSAIADITQDDRIGLQESIHIMQIVAQVL